MLASSKSLNRALNGAEYSPRSRIDTAKSIDYWKHSSSKRPTTVVITGQSRNCTVCETPVYPVEQMLVDSHSLHPNCFRCRHCNQLLSLSNNEKVEGSFFCKAHYRLYSSGNDSIRTNPLLANARYSSALSSPIEARSALGRSISGKKAAYESLVNAGNGAQLERSKTESHSAGGSLLQLRSCSRRGRLERPKSMGTITGSFQPCDGPTEKPKETPVIMPGDFPVSKIVQDRLRLYERLDENTSASPAKTTGLDRSLLNGAAPGFILESAPTSRTNTFPTFSPAQGASDPSFAAAHRTNIRSRIRSYQGQGKPETEQATFDSSLAEPSGDSEDEVGEVKSPGKLTRTFKGVMDALISSWPAEQYRNRGTGKLSAP
ncbi:hypothetical protein DSO57_1017909 [Entomophthora muscae]|uniref:Uncharacterized protein n=1 Tax=Entomophthora muscae TaxID=34485 RepID=A0ACC2RJ04_9FUNG|nr:hypothetical protein DSO57_1017909 [Entomophthora muscae]